MPNTLSHCSWHLRTFCAISCGSLFAAAQGTAAPASVRLTPSFAAHGERTPVSLTEQVLWRNAPLTSKLAPPQPSRLELQRNLRTALASDPTLGELYSWRQALRGNGTRSWRLGGTGAKAFRLGFGAQTLPILQLSGLRGTRAALALNGERFGVYTTRPLRALNASLAASDEVLGESPARDASALDWVTLRPLQNKHGALDVIYLHGQNDLAPNSLTKTSSQFMRGEMAGASLAYALPMRWKMNGEWLTSHMEERAADSAWQLALAGPIAHPWGATGVKISYRDVGENFVSFGGAPSDAGSTTKSVALQQPLGQGTWSGALGLNWSQKASEAAGAATDSDLAATASARWQVSPDVALSGALGTQSSTQDGAAVLNTQQSTNGRAAVEWKVLDSVQLSLGYDATRQSTPASDNDSKRVALGVQQRFEGTTWNLQLARATRDTSGRETAIADSLALGAEHRLASWLKLGGSYRIARNDAACSDQTPNSNWTARATMSLQELGSLELRYSQALGAQDGGVRFGDENVTRGYGVHYVLGAANGQGLGLALDFSQRDLVGYDDPTRRWRIGVTYR